MAINTQVIIFKDKTLANVLEDIYKNSKKKSGQLDGLINTLTKMINNVNDAALVVPLVKEYLDIAVKNDDQLVKLAAIVQRIMSATTTVDTDGAVVLSDSEKEQLFKLAQDQITTVNLPAPEIITKDAGTSN